IQDRARLTLINRGKAAVPALTAAVEGKAEASVKQHAVWALAGIADESTYPPLRGALRAVDPNVVIPAIRALAVRGDRSSTDHLCQLLTSHAPSVQLAAAESLARCGDASALPALWKALQGQPDLFLQHALIHAVHRLADSAALNAALKQIHPRVQKAALLLLDQPPRLRGALAQETVIARVSAADPELRQAALSVLQRHPEWAEYAIGLLRRWMGRAVLSTEEESGLRALLLAFQRRPSVEELMAEALAEKSATPAERQLLVLETMGQANFS